MATRSRGGLEDDAEALDSDPAGGARELDDERVLDALLERHGADGPSAVSIERRRIREREVGALCASLESVGVPTEGLRRKLMVLTVEMERPARPVVIAILQTGTGDPPEQRHVLRVLGESEESR
jgi:hypothetical protein